MTVSFNNSEIAELYRMVQWWCHDQSNTFHRIKVGIEQQYPEVAELNRLEFDFESGQGRLVERPEKQTTDKVMPKGALVSCP